MKGVANQFAQMLWGAKRKGVVGLLTLLFAFEHLCPPCHGLTVETRVLEPRVRDVWWCGPGHLNEMKQKSTPSTTSSTASNFIGCNESNPNRFGCDLEDLVFTLSLSSTLIVQSPRKEENMKFSFATTRRILSSLGGSSQAGSIMQELGCRRVAIVTDKGVRAANLLDAALESLEGAGVTCHIYDDVRADPPLADVLEASRWAKELQVDGVLGIGGGSPLDVAKLIAFLNGDTTQAIDDLWGVGQCKGNRLPLVQVPTTAGTGSEVTPISIITTGEGQKKGVVSPQLLPDVAICDGDLTLSVPRHVTAATGIDAMVHCTEAYTSALLKNPLSDMLAKEGLRLLGANIRAVCEDGSNREARGKMLLGSTIAGMAFANAPVGAVHALAYPIGANFKVPHGLSCCLMLPHVLRFNGALPAADALYGEILHDAFPHTAAMARDGRSSTELFAAGFDELAADLGIETKLTQVGISAADIDMMAEQAMLQTRLLPNNPRAVSNEDAKALYTQAL